MREVFCYWKNYKTLFVLQNYLILIVDLSSYIYLFVVCDFFEKKRRKKTNILFFFTF